MGSQKPRKSRNKSYFEDLSPESDDKLQFTASIGVFIGLHVFIGQMFDLNVYQMHALLMSIFVIHCTYFLLKTVLTSDSLHFVRVRRKPLANSSSLYLPYGIESNDGVSLMSISNMIGLAGSNAERTASATVYPVSAIAINATLLNINSCGFNIINTALLTSMCGLWMLVMWPWDGREHTLSGIWNNGTKGEALHLLGVAMFCGGTFVAFNVQSQSWLLLLFFIVTVHVFTCVWVLTMANWIFKGKHIHDRSVILIVSEILGMLAVGLADLVCVWELNDCYY
eukprot:847491_1